MDEAVKADRIIVVNDGEIFLDGTPKEVFEKVEKLRSVGLDVPQGRELMYELSASGVNFSDTPIDIESCAKLILEKYNQKDRK